MAFHEVNVSKLKQALVDRPLQVRMGKGASTNHYFSSLNFRIASLLTKSEPKAVAGSFRPACEPAAQADPDCGCASPQERHSHRVFHHSSIAAISDTANP